MSSDRLTRRFACLGLLGLAGCGFAPVYGDGRKLAGAFRFETDDSVLGYFINQRLAERLGQPDNARYVIKVAATANERAAAITAEGDTARLNVIGEADWSMVSIAAGKQIATATANAFTSYSATGSTVATQSTRDDARQRLAVILADMIVTRILAMSPDLQG